MAIATVTRPTSSLPDPGDAIDAEPVRDYITNVLAFLESASLKSGNVDSTSVDAILAADIVQVSTGKKDWQSTAAAAGGIREVAEFGLNPVSGTATAADGGRLVFYADNASGTKTDIAYLDFVLTVATGGAEVARMDLYVSDTSGAAVSQVQIGDGFFRPTTDSDVSLGTTALRFSDFFTDSITSGTLTLAAGSITDSSGAISFGNENLSTTGTLASGALTVTGAATATTTFTAASDLAIGTGSVTSASGAISFGNENLTTTGTLAAGATTVTGALRGTNLGVNMAANTNAIAVTTSAVSKAFLQGINSTGNSGVLFDEDSGGDARLVAYNAAGAAKVLLHSDGDSYLLGGNVGIGVTPITSFAPVFQITGTDPALLITDSATAVDYAGIYISSGSAKMYYDDAATFDIGTASDNAITGFASKFHISASGNVGIGMTPLQDFSLAGTAAAAPTLQTFSVAANGENTLTGVTVGEIQFQHGATTAATTYSYFPGIRAKGQAGGASFGRYIDLELFTTAIGETINLQLAAGGAVKNPLDNAGFYTGIGDDLRMYHDGTNSFVQNITGSSAWKTTDSFYIYVVDGTETAASFIGNGAATLYYDNAAKLATVTNGVDVTGRLNATTFIYAPSGFYVGSNGSNNYLIDDASNGAGSTTLYIGNASINVTSDRRAKRNVEDFTGAQALDLVNQARVVSFDYIPEMIGDESEYGPSSRGRYVGMIAQEMKQWAPWAVNDGDGSEGDHMWKAEYDHLVGVLFAAVQAQQEQINTLKARLN
jgi:hypothetical protein